MVLATVVLNVKRLKRLKRRKVWDLEYIRSASYWSWSQICFATAKLRQDHEMVFLEVSEGDGSGGGMYRVSFDCEYRSRVPAY